MKKTKSDLFNPIVSGIQMSYRKISFILSVISLFVLFGHTTWAADITIEWDTNNEADYYIVYYGNESQQYTESTDVIEAPTTEATIAGLSDESWFFVVKAFNQCGNSSNFSEEISYSPSPSLVATISSPSSAVSIDEGSYVNFQGNVSGGSAPYQYEWAFGTGGPSDSLQEDPGNVTFSDAGTYTVTYTVTDSDNDVSTDTVTVTVNEQIVDTTPVATIDSPASNISITEGESISFQATVTNGNATFSHTWDFGNNGPADSNQEDPGNITFPDAGVFTVTYTVIDSDSDSASDSVTVTVNEQVIDVNPVAAITLPSGNVSIVEGESVDFQGNVSSGNAPFTHSWVFGSGGPASRTIEDPGTITFPDSGTYTVTYTVTDADNDTSTASRVVTVNQAVVDTNPVAAITSPASNISIVEGDSVNFQGSTSGGNAPFSYVWNFGSGGPSGRLQEDPGSIVFPSSGTYEVVYTVTDDDGDAGSDTVIVTVAAQIPDTNPVAVIALPSSDVTIEAGDTVNFQGSVVSGNAPFSHNWNFGSGGPAESSLEDPGFVTFSGSGTYTVTYTVTDDDNDISSQTVVVTVQEKIADTNPVAVITLPSSNISITEGSAVNFQGSVVDGNSPFTYAWDFGANGPGDSTVEDPGYKTFSSPGTYTVTYTVTDSDNDISFDRVTVTVNEIQVDTNPDVTITSPSSDIVINKGDSVTFAAEVAGGEGPFTYQWYFGSGGPSSSLVKDPGDITFTSTGTFNVAFRAVDKDGDSDSASVTVTVNDEVVVDPEQPEPVYPSDELGVSVTPKLVADVNPSGSGTRWQISSNPYFTALLLDVFKVNDISSLTVPRLILNNSRTYYWRVKQTTSKNMETEWSASSKFTTVEGIAADEDGNGVPDDQEVTEGVDLNHDGVADNLQQDSIMCIRTIIGDTNIGLVKLDKVTSIDVLESIDHTTVEDMTNMPDEMPVGLIGFKIGVETPGDTVKLRVCMTEAAPENASWYKYDSVSGWTDYSSNAIFSSDRKMIDITLTDGGTGDADGAVNGVIVDPAGLGIKSTSSVPSFVIGGAEAAEGCFINSSGNMSSGILPVNSLSMMFLRILACLALARLYRKAFPK